MKIKIVTFNLRTIYSTYDGVNSFIHRAGMILDKMKDESPDIICFQEVGKEIRKFLQNYLIHYHIVGHGRLSDYSCEGLGVAFRKDCMELIGLEQFWLSPTPQIPGTRYEVQSEYPRTCIYAILKHKDMKTPIRVYDVHLDHEGEPARVLGIKQIFEKVKNDNAVIKFPTFVLGDFNAQPDSETVAFCDGYEDYPMKDITKDSGETFHNFGGTGHAEYARGRKIDYIYTDLDTASKVKSIKKWDDNKNGVYLSDHYPICCEVEFNENF